MNTDGVVYSCIKHLHNHFKAVFFIKMRILRSFAMGDSQSLKTQGEIEGRSVLFPAICVESTFKTHYTH